MLKVLHTKGVGGLRAEKEGKEKKSKNNQLKSSDTGASLWMGALPSTGLRTLML